MQSKGFRRFKRNRIFILFLLLAGVALTFVLVKQELKLQEMNLERAEISKEAVAMKTAVDKLKAEVEALDTDAAKESLARQKLNMIKRDEILYIVKSKDQ